MSTGDPSGDTAGTHLLVFHAGWKESSRHVGSPISWAPGCQMLTWEISPALHFHALLCPPLKKMRVMDSWMQRWLKPNLQNKSTLIQKYSSLKVFGFFFLRLKKCLVLAAESYLTLCVPMDCSPQGCSVHVILQARILEWVAMPSSRRLF